MLTSVLSRYMIFLVVIGLVFSVLVTVALSHHASFYDANGHYYGQDFINYWAAPQLAATDITQLFDTTRYNPGVEALYGSALPLHNWSYPLHALLLMRPFGYLPLPTAYVVWSLLGLTCYGLLAARFAPTQRRHAALLALLSPASMMCLLFGQNGFFTASLFLGAWMVLTTRPRLAGVALGILTVKPQLGLLWPFLLLQQKRWRTIACATLVSALLISLTLLSFGTEAWRGYLDGAAAYQWALLRESLAGRQYETMMPTVSNGLQLLGLDAGTAYVLQILVAITVTLLLLRDRHRNPSFTTRSTLLVATAALLITPYFFNYDMTLITAALVWHMLARPPATLWERWLYAFTYFTPVLVYYFYFSTPLSPFILLALFFTVLRQKAIAVP